MTIKYIKTNSKLLNDFGIKANDYNCIELMKKYDLLFVFSLALTIRLIFMYFLNPTFSAINADTIEYYLTSINLEPHKFFRLLWGYENWYERTPVYVLFLHVIQRQLIIQVILSSIGCVMMYRINKTAGILWIFYLQDIIYSFQYNKESLLLFSIILVIYFLRNRKLLQFILIPVIILGFVSYGGVIKANINLSKGHMLNFWHIWQPSFNTSIAYGKVFVYLQMIPYILSMFYFIKKIKILSAEFGVFIILSLAYGLIYAEPRYREPFMPLLFLFIAEPVKDLLRKIYNKKLKLSYILELIKDGISDVLRGISLNKPGIVNK